MLFVNLRKQYHQRICREIIRIQPGNPPYPNFADKTNKTSREIAWSILKQIGYQVNDEEQLAGQTTGGRFEDITREYLSITIDHLQHIRPGKWLYRTGLPIAEFDQYEHLARLKELTKTSSDLASVLGSEYIIIPDIVIARAPKRITRSIILKILSKEKILPD